MGYSLITLNRTPLNELPLQKGSNDILKVLTGGGGDENIEEPLIVCARDVKPENGICLTLATISIAELDGMIQCTIESGSSSDVSVDGTRLKRGRWSELQEGCIIDIDGLKLIVVEIDYLVKQVQLPTLQQGMLESEVTMRSHSMCKVCCTLNGTSLGAMQVEDNKNRGLRGAAVAKVKDVKFSEKEVDEAEEEGGLEASKLIWEDVREHDFAVEDDSHDSCHTTSVVGSGIVKLKSCEKKAGGAGVDVLQLAGFPSGKNSTVEHRSYIKGYFAAWFVAKILDVKVEGRALSSLTAETAEDWREHVQCYLTFPDYPDEPLSWVNLFPQPNRSIKECPCSIRPMPPPQMTKEAYDNIEDKNTCQYPMVVRRTSWEVGDAVEWLWKDAWWWGHISYISAKKMKVRFPGAPLGNGKGETRSVRSEELRASVLWENGTWKVASLVEMPAGLSAQSGKEPLATILWAPPISNQATSLSKSTGIGGSERLASTTNWSCDTNSQKLNQSAEQGSQNILPESQHGGFRPSDGPFKKRSLAELSAKAKGGNGARFGNGNVNIVYPSIPNKKPRALLSPQGSSSEKLGSAATTKGGQPFKPGHLKRQGETIACNWKLEDAARKKYKIAIKNQAEVARVRRCSYENFGKVAKTRVNSSPKLGHLTNDGNSESEGEVRKEHEIPRANRARSMLLPTRSSKKLNQASTPDASPSLKRGHSKRMEGMIDCDHESRGVVRKEKDIIRNCDSYENRHDSGQSGEVNIEILLDWIEVIFELKNIPSSSRVAYAIDVMARSLAQAWKTRSKNLRRFVNFDNWEIFRKEISSTIGIKSQKRSPAITRPPLQGRTRLQGKFGLEEMKMSLSEVQRNLYLLSLDQELRDMFYLSLEKQLQEVTSLSGKAKLQRGSSKAQLMRPTAASLSQFTNHCIVREYHNLFV